MQEAADNKHLATLGKLAAGALGSRFGDDHVASGLIGYAAAPLIGPLAKKVAKPIVRSTMMLPGDTLYNRFPADIMRVAAKRLAEHFYDTDPLLLEDEDINTLLLKDEDE